MESHKLLAIQEFEPLNKNLIIYIYNISKNVIEQFLESIKEDNIISYKKFFNDNLIFLIFKIISIGNNIKDFMNKNKEEKINMVITILIYIICFKFNINPDIRDGLIDSVKVVVPLIIDDINYYSSKLYKKELIKYKLKKLFCCCNE
jgi:hypothetical protein